ncbi:TIGR04013 family B12-binding domain/radical SAM domain-containing protein [Aeropyrum camini]|uniref:Fe-S oxidoreductase n=1 Tax=Aeropyrum camini SY1 = JCM 12091 TaxID=1198449 RepID=U3THH6_9CREN|nr:TIGR04013 family B12-binding domain/radical SAM domain-containing protein [Aeropyrum camini]BAN90789.1 Fe-S oxidoreductase [Aeropyrum camini SY1 = JCM 12091]
MSSGSRVYVLMRSVYGGRNAFAPVASALAASGLDVRIRIVESSPEPIARELLARGRRVVVMYGVTSPAFLELAGEIHRVSRIAPTIVGGPHAAGAYWQVLRLGAAAAVVGDGEIAAVEVVERVAEGMGLEEPPSNTAVRSGGRFKVGPVALASLDDYTPHYPQLGLYPPIEIMRGCSYRCRFCQVPWEFKSQVRFRSVGSVAKAAADYVAAGKREIRFIAPIGFAYGSEDLRTPNPAAVEELLSSVRAVGGKPYLGSFPSETRPEFVTPEILRVVRRLAYNRRISIGLQSGSDMLLERIGRGHGVDEAVRAAGLALEHGFTPVVDIIFGMPGEDEEDVVETVKAMYRLSEMGARLRLHHFLPLPGTPFARIPPKPLHPLYRRAVLKLLGRGVLEGYWREQERLGLEIYCMTALDPAPTREPQPLRGSERLCSSVWKAIAPARLEPYSGVVEGLEHRA